MSVDEKSLALALGKAIASIRIQKAMSQEDFSSKAEIHRTYLSDIEQGRRNLSLFVLYRLARSLEMTAIDLLHEAEELIPFILSSARTKNLPANLKVQDQSLKNELLDSNETSLAFVYPEIAAEWHPTHNGELRPEDVSINCSKAVWWRCRFNHDHVWKSEIVQRTLHEARCSFCTPKSRKTEN